MGKLIISTNVTLDGVVQDPAGDEGFAHGGWVGRIAALPELAQVALDEALEAEALLLGRRSYEWFAGRWPSRSGALADRLNGMPKYVVSSTLEEPALGQHDGPDRRRRRGGREAQADARRADSSSLASFQLVRTLLEHDLVDELRLKVFPVVLGSGARLFGETSDKRPLRLLDSRTLGDGVAFLTYELLSPTASSSTA